jgi:DNA (cytosine-5)-methyltransferase 1
VGFCEIDRYCQELLKIRFPGAKIYGDIKILAYILNSDTDNRGQAVKEQQTTGNKQSDRGAIADTESGKPGEQAERKGWEDTGRGNFKVDLLTGGFPCQPFSQAGKRNGTQDDRHLWPYMLKVIAEVKPTWVIGENVFGIASMAVGQSEIDVESDTDNADGDNGESGADGVLWTVINDLEQIGYAVQTFVIPACGVNAPHKRDRVWIVANAGCGNGEGAAEYGEHERENSQGNAIELERPAECNKSGLNTDTTGKRPDLGQCNRGERYVQDHERTTTEDNTERNGRQCRAGQTDSNDTHARCKGLERGRYKKREYSSQCDRGQGTNWNKNWLEVATRLCGVDDGLPAELDGFKLSKAGHRVARLKGLGNSICPQVVIEIMQCIKQIDSKD